VEAIGSQIRIGQPYIDVTTIIGIEQAGVAPPQCNRGGHIETLPEVSRSMSRTIPGYTISISLFLTVSLVVETPPHAQGR
jgi:hypothetical protein